MARSCGIRLSLQRYEIVVLEGTSKKPKVVAALSGEIAPGEDAVNAIAQSLRETIKSHKLPTDNVGLVVDTGLAAFRTLTLPFDDRAKIEEVIKFEVESQLPQWSIDEVVVDFLELDTKPGETQLLVTALQKANLKPLLEACEKAGLDPLEAELEASAVANVAILAEIADPEGAQILVHVGERATSVIVLDGGKLHSLRAIQTGPAPVPTAAGEDALAQKPASAPVVFDADAVARLRRELLRTLLGAQTDHPLKGVWLSGYAPEGLVDEASVGAPVRWLEPFAAGEGGATHPPQHYVAAFGTALARLGGVPYVARLRREELTYSGKFERLELPLAVAGLLMVALLSVYSIMTWKTIQQRDVNLKFWLASSNNYMLGEPKKGTTGRLKHPSDAIKKYCDQAANDLDTERTRWDQFVNIRNLLKREIATLQKDLGQDAQIPKPQSAFEGLSLVLGVMSEMGDAVGRVGMRQTSADYNRGGGLKPDTVTVKLNLAFYAEDTLVATQHYEAFVSELTKKPWCVEAPLRGSTPLDGGSGIYVENLILTLDLSKLERKAQVAAAK